MDSYLRKLLKRPHLYAWEKDYRIRGALWRGPFLSFSFWDFLPPGARVLELGCGDGKTLSALCGAGFEVTGIDVSPTAVKFAGKKTGKKARLIVGDVCKLPFRDNSFDAVIGVHVFDHLSQTERTSAANEATRVLKPGGLLFFQGFSVNDDRFGSGVEVEQNTFRRKNNVWYHYFSLEEVENLFRGMAVMQLQEKCSEKTRLLIKRCVVRFIGRR